MRQHARRAILDHRTRRAGFARNPAFDEIFVLHVPVKRRHAMHPDFTPGHLLPMRNNLLREVGFSDVGHPVKDEVLKPPQAIKTLDERHFFDPFEAIGVVGHRRLERQNEPLGKRVEVDERLFALIVEAIDEFSHDLAGQIVEPDAPQIQIPRIGRQIVAMRALDHAQKPRQRAQIKRHRPLFAVLQKRRYLFQP